MHSSVDRERVPGERPELQSVDVALLIPVEVLRRGVLAMLEQFPEVAVVSASGMPTSWPERAEPTTRLLIVTFEEWWQISADDRMTRPDRPLVVVLGDDLHSKGIIGNDLMPCDGVMSMAELTEPALRTVLARTVAGELPMPAALARQLLSTTQSGLHRSGGQPIALTQREHETLGLLAQGLSNKQIAKALGISTHGVKRLVGTVLLKTGAANRTAAVITALNNGLV